MNYKPCNYTSFADRWHITTKYLSRMRKRGLSSFLLALFSPASWQHLFPTQPLDGLSMFKQSVSKLSLPSQLGQPGGKVIMLISRC